MPFTLAHPAIILPLRKGFGRWFSFTGLVIGSMSPDFEYFLRTYIKSTYSHTGWGLILFNLPVALLMAYIFHNIVRNPFIAHLPTPLRARGQSITNFNWNSYFREHWFIVIYSILLGAFSHLFWDAFTHKEGYFVEQILMLQKTIEMGKYQVPVFKILQHGSTLLGGVIILYFIYKQPAPTPPKSNKLIPFWSLVVLISALFFSFRLLVLNDLNRGGHLIVALISAVAVGITLTTTLYKYRIYSKYKKEHY